MRLDAHHHFWRYNPTEFDWIDDDMAAIRRDFLPADLAAEIRAELPATLAVTGNYLDGVGVPACVAAAGQAAAAVVAATAAD